MKSIVLTFLLFSSMACCSQAYKYRFRTNNLPEEFKNEYTSLVDEDAAGMLWFVTNTGLHRYDGNQVLSFDLQSTPSLPDADIHLLMADSRNRLWIATRKHLVCFDLQRWTTRSIPYKKSLANAQEVVVNTLGEGKDGTVYAGCGRKLYRIANDSLELVLDTDKQIQDPDAGMYINSIQEPVPGYVLLSTSNGKIIAVRHQQKIFSRPAYVKLQPAGAPAGSPALETSRKYVVNVSAKGPYLLDMEQLSAVPIAIASLPQNHDGYEIAIGQLDDNQYIAICPNPSRAGTSFLIYKAEKNVFEDFSAIYPVALKSNRMRALGNRNGNILIPCSGGVTTIAYTNGAFDVFGVSLENTNSVRAIYKQPGGSLYVGSYLHNFVAFDEVSGTSTSRSGNLISCILPWRKDTFLVGTEGGGLRMYMPGSDRYINLFARSGDDRVDANVICVTRENDTSFWAGTSHGVFWLNPYSNRILKSTIEQGNLLQQSAVYDILKVGQSCFFATQAGLFKYDIANKRLVKLLTGKDGNYADSYFTCLELANNRIWAGTVGNGMLVLDTTGRLLRKITTAEGLSGNIIFSNPVCKNNLFVGTRTGLSIIDINSEKISNYSSEYYLPANEFNRSACFVNGDTVYMGTINGLIRIDIKRLQQQQASVVTGVCFSKFTFNNGSSNTSNYTVPYHKDLSLIIPPDATNFSIGFGGLSQMANGLTLYYRLDAADSWQEIGQRREVTFINISPNHYTMQIAARLPDGKWMENLLSLPITVQPHFYQTWWWKGLLFAAALGLIWLGINYREKALRKEEQLRSRIAGDLHDEVGSALTRIFVQAGMLITTKGAAPPPAAALQQIASSSQEALSSMSDMVWSIDAHYDNALDMVDRIRDYIARLREELDCHCTFQVSGNHERLRLSQVLRQNILLIFKEAMNNAIKYGVDRTVVINLVLDEHLLLLEVMNELPATSLADNSVQGGHGMKSMQLRADKIRARLSIDQTDTTFTVRLQLKPS